MTAVCHNGFRCSEKAEKGSKWKKKERKGNTFCSVDIFIHSVSDNDGTGGETGRDFLEEEKCSADIIYPFCTKMVLGMLFFGKCYKFWEHNLIDLPEQN